MSIQYVKVHTRTGLLDASNRALALAREKHLSVTLVVPSSTWMLQRKMGMRNSNPVGVNIQTHRQWISSLWDLYGDGSTIIEPAARNVLLRPLVSQVGLLEASPSPKLVATIGSFVEEAIAPGLMPRANLSESQAKVMELVSLYEHKLELEGHIELAQAEQRLVQQRVCAPGAIVLEQPDLQSAHIKRFIEGAGEVAHITVVTQEFDVSVFHGEGQPASMSELESLRYRLFTGSGGTQAQGQVYVGEAHGAHAEGELIMQLLRILHEQDDIAYGDMLLCLGSVSDAHPRLFETLARARIPFVARFGLPCARVGLGAAFVDLEYVLANAEDESTYEHLVDFVCSPYSGIRGEDARAVQMRWRERAHSTAEKRIEDLRLGFAQGNANAAVMAERLKPVVEILDAPRSQRVRLMFENARKLGLDADTLIDDRAAADCLLDYIELCERYLCEPDIDEMANLPVALARAYGEQDQAIALISSGDLNLASAQAVILTDLDAAHYPMAAQAGPFDTLMDLLGIARADTLANDQRLLLLNAIESSEARFAFCRSMHDVAGDESCASALYEEILTAYRSRKDEEDGLPPQSIPSALQPWSVTLSEADAFFEKSGEPSRPPYSAGTSSVSFARGTIENDELLVHLMLDQHDKPMPFSPTGLEDYYRCPYRWFTCRRVGYNGMDCEFDASSQGNFVHATMERFYGDLRKAGFDRVTPQNLPEALDIARSSFDTQLEHDKNRSRGGLYLRTQQDEKVCDELKLMVLSLVERDAEFLPDFVPTYFELTLGRGTGSILEYAGVPVRGKVDRIDVDSQGNAIVIDYKLSGLSAGYGFAKDDVLPLRIQTDIYATLVQRHFESINEPLRVVGSVYRSYSKNSMRGVYARGIAWGNTEVIRDDYDALPRPSSNETYEEYLGRVEDEVRLCMQRLQAGDIAPRPIAKGVCDYCRASSFCPERSE